MLFRLSRLVLATLTISGLLVVHASHTSALASSSSTWSSCPTPLVGAQFSAPSLGTGARTVALTFDDGPGASTARILSILLAFHVRATFFNIGVSESSWSSDVVQEAMDGFDLADHTWSHPNMTNLPPAQQRTQLEAAASEQRSLVGSSPCGFRPPYGAYNSVTSSVSRSLAMSEWMWNVDTRDWQAGGSSSPYWVQRIVALAESEGQRQNNPIILLHDQATPMPATVAALPTIIRYFLARHYQFVDLLGRTGPPDSCGTSQSLFSSSPRRYVPSPGVLPSGSVLHSPNGQFTLSMGRDGVLSLAGDGRELWRSSTHAHRGASASLDSSGALTVRTTHGAVVWRSAGSHPHDRLSLGDDGELSLTSGTRVWWSTNTHLSSLGRHHSLRPGWTLYSANAQCRLIMAPVGQLRMQSSSYGTLWTSQGERIPGSSAVLEDNGSFVVVSPTHHVTWASGSLGANLTLQITNSGRAVIRTPSGHWSWSTP